MFNNTLNRGVILTPTLYTSYSSCLMPSKLRIISRHAMFIHRLGALPYSFVFLVFFALSSCDSGEENTLVDLKEIFVNPVVSSVVAVGDSVELATGDKSTQEQEHSDQSNDLAKDKNIFDLNKQNLTSCQTFEATKKRISDTAKANSAELNNALSWTSNSDIPLFLLGEYSYLTSFSRSCQFEQLEGRISKDELINGKLLDANDNTQATISIEQIDGVNVNLFALQMKEFDMQSLDTPVNQQLAQQPFIRFVRAYQTVAVDESKFRFTVEHELQVRATRRDSEGNYFQPGVSLLEQTSDIYLQQRFTVLMADDGNRQLIGVFSSYKYQKECAYQTKNHLTDYSAYDTTVDASGDLYCLNKEGSKHRRIADLDTHTMTYTVAIDGKVLSGKGGSISERSICTRPVPTNGLYKPQLCQQDYVDRNAYLNNGDTKAIDKHSVKLDLNDSLTEVHRQMVLYANGGQFPQTLQQAAELFGVLDDKVSKDTISPQGLLNTDITTDLPKFGQPPHPGAVRVDASADGTVTVRWAAKEDGSTYNIYYAADNFADDIARLEKLPLTWHTYANGRLLQNQLPPRIIDGLDSGVTYHFVVTAVDDNGMESIPTSYSYVKSMEALSAPTNVQVKAKTRRRVNVSWAGDVFTPYKVEYQRAGENTWEQPVGDIRDISVDVHNLSPGNYFFRVTSLGGKGAEFLSRQVPFIVLGGPTDITTQLHGSTATISWNGELTASYRVMVFRIDNDVRIMDREVIMTNGNTVTIDNLQPDYEYQFSVEQLYSYEQSVVAPPDVQIHTGSIESAVVAPLVAPTVKSASLQATDEAITFTVLSTPLGATHFHVRGYYDTEATQLAFDHSMDISALDGWSRGGSLPLTIPVQNGRAYYVSLSARDVNSNTESETIYLGQVTPLKTPEVNYTVDSVTNDAIKLTINWETIPGALTYGITAEYRSHNFDRWRKFYDDHRDASPVTLLYTGTQHDTGAFSISIAPVVDDNTQVTGTRKILLSDIIKTVVPPEVSNVTVTAGDGQVDLSWDAVEDATSYTVYWQSSNSQGNNLQDAGDRTRHTVTNLDNGVAYDFWVKAVNTHGESNASNRVSATPLETPVITYQVLPNENRLIINWQSITGATGYRLTFGIMYGSKTENLVDRQLSPDTTSYSLSAPSDRGLQNADYADYTDYADYALIIRVQPLIENNNTHVVGTLTLQSSDIDTPSAKTVDNDATTDLNLVVSFKQTKVFHFTWNSIDSTDYYILEENLDGRSGFSQVVIIDPQSTSYELEVPLYARTNASYVLHACNATTCISSNTVAIIDTLVAAIGHFNASNANEGDEFGYSVSLHEDTLAVGAWQEDSDATGIGGNHTSNSANNAGAVYIFIRMGNNWVQQAYIKASNTEADDNFGQSVSLYGDTLAVGAWQEDSNATGIEGKQTDNSANNAGAVYVFTRSNDTWIQQSYIKASNTEAGDNFGQSVSLYGDTLAVGAWQEDSDATGIEGNQTNNNANNAGAVYIFARSNDKWIQQSYIKANNAEAGDNFGQSISLYGDTLAVGAWQEDSSAKGTDGNHRDNSASNAGAVYVFTRTGSKWRQQAYIKASNTDANDNFGNSVSLYDNTLAVGAYRENGNTFDISTNQLNNNADNTGAVYVFTRSLVTNTWTQDDYIQASNTNAGDEFGGKVSLYGDTLAVSAILEDSVATGLNDSPDYHKKSKIGAVYTFKLDGGVWLQSAYVKPSDISNTYIGDMYFGNGLSLHKNTLAVGAPKEDDVKKESHDIGGVYIY